MVAQNRMHIMSLLKSRAAGAFVVVSIAALGLGACASYDDDFAAMNGRMDQLDSRVQTASQNAEAASASAQSANSAAQAAATEARNANQRLDALDARVNQIEQGPVRTPRG
jgi:murein lipoprotein